jgi:hypothetical protein
VHWSPNKLWRSNSIFNQWSLLQEEEEEEREDSYGWVVVFCSFLCIAVIDGVGYTTGKQTVFFSGKIACIRISFDLFFFRPPLKSSGDRFEEWEGGDIFRRKSSGRTTQQASR